MSRTKVKQNLIDASFGNILEQIAYIADGSTITTSAGNITVPNVTARQDVSGTSYVDLTGTNISYTPPSGTTSVLYEVLFSTAHNGNGTSGYLSPNVRVTVDGTQIDKSRKGQMLNSAWDAEMNVKIPIRITGSSDNIASGTVASWSSARTIKTQIATYNTSTYRFAVNQSYYGPGSGGNNTFIVPPFIKITAYS
tara:strand:+ start:549 stop:1133 length:585 start_codon:yes stop_codon:yes gene_type:complete